MKTLTLTEQWELIKPIWRILLATMIFQIIGGIVGLSYPLYGMLLIDLWFGSAVSTAPGFLIGVVWQSINSPKIIRQNLLIVAIMGIMCVVLTISAFFMPLEQMASGLNQNFGKFF